MPGTLRPTAAIAADVLLPADPGLALALAQELIERPRMANHHHGLWGYSGARRSGSGELTVQATGLGGPSAAAVGRDLIGLGARRLIRIGACRAVSAELRGGETVVAEAALASDGASRALGAPPRVAADDALSRALLAAAQTAEAVTVAGADVLDGTDAPAAGQHGDAAVTDLETAALLALGERYGVAVGALLLVTEAGGAEPVALDERLLALGRLASVALVERGELVSDVVEPVLDGLQPP
jgi:uridine phosphorylase